MVRVLPLIGLSRYAGDYGIHGVPLIGPPHIPGTPHSDTVVITRAALRAHDVIKLSSPGQMGCFNASPVRTAPPHAPRISHDFFFIRIIFHHADGAGFFIPFPCLPFQGNNIFSAVFIMKNGCVKSRGMQVDRLTPGSSDVLCGHQKIIHVKIPCIHGVHDPVHHIKGILRLTVCKTWRPYPLCAWKLL